MTRGRADGMSRLTQATRGGYLAPSGRGVRVGVSRPAAAIRLVVALLWSGGAGAQSVARPIERTAAAPTAVRGAVVAGGVIANKAAATYRDRTAGQYPSVEDSVIVRTDTTRLLPAAVTLTKNASVSMAGLGDTVAYVVAVRNAGPGPATSVTLTDTLPAAFDWLPPTWSSPGVERWTADTLPDGRVVWMFTGASLGTERRWEVHYRGIVRAAPEAPVENLVMATFTAATDRDRTAQFRLRAAATVQLIRPVLAITKVLVREGDAPVTVGGTLTYDLRYRNPSTTATARAVVLIDRLPSGVVVDEVIATPALADVRLPGLIRWEVGTLPPGARGEVRLRLRVVSVPASGEIVNRATLEARDAVAVVAAAAAVRAVPEEAGRAVLRLEKTADVLDVGLGEAVAFVLQVTNSGAGVATNVLVRDAVPPGLTVLAGRVRGALVDRSARNGLWLRLPRPLAPGAVQTIAYRATATGEPARGTAYVNRATAFAVDRSSGAPVRREEARATVRRRQGFSLVSRLVLGSVFVDHNGDGVPSPGEPGVRGIRVWSMDGQVLVTDALGRFHIPDVTPGMVVVRLDPARVPAHLHVPSLAAQQRILRVDGWTTPAVRFALAPKLVAERLAPADRAGRGPRDAGIGEPRIGEPRIGTTRVRAEAPSAPITGEAALALARAAGVTREREAVGGRPTRPGLRTPEWLEQRVAQNVFFGPPVLVREPADGAVLRAPHVFVRVTGDPGATVVLYRDRVRVRETVVRPDRVAEFLAVPVPEGPHRLRVRSRGRWAGPTGAVQWDRIAVHRSGGVARIRRMETAPVSVRVGAVPALVTFRVEDRWGVRVTHAPAVTVVSAGVRVGGVDLDEHSAGEQRRPDVDGVLRLALAADTAGVGSLRVRAMEARDRVGGFDAMSVEVPLRVYASLDPFRSVGVASFGFGAAPTDFGSVLATGRVGAGRTASVSIDSRRRGTGADGGEGAFQRVFDPMDEARLPAMGDASIRQVLAGSGPVVSARLEQGGSFVALGDVSASAFRAGRPLIATARAVPGMSASMTRGPLTVTGYGSQTTQLLVQRQWRGNGTPGPIALATALRAGTDAVYLETRALENAARIMLVTPLVRFVDYDVDYAAGVILLRRMIPATDPAGNPLFVRVRAEQVRGGTAQWVTGLRTAWDMTAAWARGREVASDAVRLVWGVSHAREPVALRPRMMIDAGRRAVVGRDVVLRRQTATQQWSGAADLATASTRVRGGVASAVVPKALAFDAQWRRVHRARVAVQWVRVDSGFDASLDPRLAVGQAERRIRVEVPLAQHGVLSLAHEAQSYPQLRSRRAQTTLERRQQVGRQRFVERVQWLEDVIDADAPRDALGRVDGARKASTIVARRQWTPWSTFDLWSEVSRSRWFQADALGQATRPDGEAVGVTWRAPRGLAADLTQRWARWVPVDSSAARAVSVTALRVRSGQKYGAQVRSGLEWQHEALGDNLRARQAAVLGYDQRLTLGAGWHVTGAVERRIGLERLSVVDPVRALPFVQLEPNRIRRGVALQWSPSAAGARFLLRGDQANATDLTRQHVESVADWPIREQVAVLARVRSLEQRSRQGDSTAWQWQRRADQRVIVGLALRPSTRDMLHVLAKLEARRTATPGLGLGTVVGGARDERRMIGIVDAVLRPPQWSAFELDARWAMRWAQWRGDQPTDQRLGPDTFAAVPLARHFLGMTATYGRQHPVFAAEGGRRPLWARVRAATGLRVDGRRLVVADANQRPWSSAVSLLEQIDPRMQVEVGYRAGPLRDRDFSRAARAGWFAVVNVVFTERHAPSAWAFWRERVRETR